MTYNTLNYGEQGGERWVIGGDLDVVSGGELDIENGAALKIAGTDVTSILAASVAAPVAGVAAGYKLARGTATFATAASVVVATGLTTVVAFIPALRKATGLDSGTAFVTHAAPSSANVTCYAWVVAGTANASAEDVIDWIAVGT